MSANANIEQAYTREYTANLRLASQQTNHRFADTYLLTTGLEGEQAVAVDLVGAMTGGKRKGRLEDIEDNAPSHATPWYVPDAYVTGAAIDQFDRVKSRIGLDGAYVKAGVAWANTSMDDQILAAFFADMKTGANGTSTESFDTSNYRVANTIGASAQTGMNVAKLLRARKLIKQAEVDIDDPDNALYCAINAQMEEELLSDLRVASKDYRDKSVFDSAGKHLMSWWNIQFIHTERLAKVSTDYAVPFWAKSGMAVGEWQPLLGDIRQLTGKKMKPWYNEVSFIRGATRTEQKKVIQILSKA